MIDNNCVRQEEMPCSSCGDKLQTWIMPGAKPTLKSHIYAQGQFKLLTNS